MLQENFGRTAGLFRLFRALRLDSGCVEAASDSGTISRAS